MENRIQTLVKYLVPTILTNVCVFLFGIIDGIFVGNGVGTDALGAVNIVWPFVMITYGLNVLTSIGGVTIAAIRFGRGDVKGANEAFIHALIMTVMIAIVLTFLGTVMTDPISRLLGGGNTYIDMVRQYLFWYTLFTIPSSLAVNLEHFCRNDGNPGLVALTTFLSTLMNIFLDWLFVFPLQMGIMGAALASGLSQTFSFFVILTHYLGHRGNLRFERVKLKASMFKKITVRGTPDMISQFASPVSIFCMNTVLAPTYGDLGINTYAIICYVASFALAIMYGVSEGLQPLFGQCYGARRERDLKFYLRAGFVIALIGSALCVLMTDFLAHDICRLYATNAQTTESVVTYLPKYSIGLIFSGVSALISAYLYSTKRSGSSITFNVFRSFILNAFSILILPIFFGKEIIWYSNTISELLVIVLGLYLIRSTEREGILFN